MLGSLLALWQEVLRFRRPVSFGVVAALVFIVFGVPKSVLGQDRPPADVHIGVAPESWRWTTDANAFFGYNYQHRKFTDFSAWESQNWFMVAGSRSVGAGRLTLEGMLSLEPFTMRALGSPQLYATWR